MPEISRQVKFYELLVPSSIFGEMTDEEMEKKIVLELPAGIVEALYELLKQEQTQYHPAAPGNQTYLFQASVATTAQMLQAAKDAGLPINTYLIDIYQGLNRDSRAQRPLGEIAKKIKELSVRGFDPFDRELNTKEGNLISRLPIFVDQLDLVGRILLEKLREMLGENTSNITAIHRFMHSIGALQIILNDIRKAALGLPVRTNFIRVVEASFDYISSNETRI